MSSAHRSPFAILSVAAFAFLAGCGKPAEARPAAEQHRVENRNREAAVDLGLLRQVGDSLGRTFDAAFDMRGKTQQRLEQRALAGPVGADNGGHFGSRYLGRHMVHRRMAIVTHGQIDKAKDRIHDRAHQAQTQSTADTPNAIAMRAEALMA